MSNKEKILWCIFGGVLVLLFLLSSTDLIIAEKKKEVHLVSVIVADSNDEYFIKFRKGMDNAAEKLQADVNFITLYHGNDVEEQMEMIQREVKDGADAIILDPVNEDDVLRELDSIAFNCPVILLGETAGNSSVAVSIHEDRDAVGKMLAEHVTEAESADDQVWLFTEGLKYSGNREIYEAIREVLEMNGFTYRLIEKTDENRFVREIGNLTAKKASPVTIVAMDTVSLHEVADLVDGREELDGKISGIYGVGSTIGILRQMEKGIVDGVVVNNRYDEGYSSVYYAVEAIQGDTTETEIVLESFYIDRESLRDPQYEKLLYPIE